MIDPKSLRIGNYLDRNGRMEVLAIGKDKIRVYDHYNRVALKYFLPADSFSGIPLSENELLRLGFFLFESEDVVWQNRKMVIRQLNKGFRFMISDSEDDYYYGTSIAIEFVHDAQNLFYDLHRTELTYQENIKQS